MGFVNKVKLPNNEVQYIKNTIIPVIGTQTSSTASWTGNIDIPNLYDGLTIVYFLPYNSIVNTKVTLNLTLSNGSQTGSINCYYNTERLTTHYSKGSNIIMTFWGTGSISVDGTATTDDRWVAQADYNTNTWRNVQVNGTQKLDTATNTGALNFKNGTNTTVSYDSGIKINAVDTTYTIATGDNNGQIKVTPSSGNAYNVSVKGLGDRAFDSTNYLPLSGGTLTGALTINGKHLILKHTNIDRDGEAVTSNTWGNSELSFYDKDGERIGLINVQKLTTGEIKLGIIAENETTDGENIYNEIDILMKPDKTRTYSISDPANFRSALQITACPKSGTAKRLAYYSSATQIDSSTGLTYNVKNSTASTSATRTILGVFGTTYGNTAEQLISNTKGLFSYGDGGPQINFGTTNAPGESQDGALIFTDHDSAATGASWHFVSNQADWNVISKRFHARTSMSIGTDLPVTAYALNVTGGAQFTDSIIGNNSGGGFHLGRDNACIKKTIVQNRSTYYPIFSVKALNSDWSIGTLGNDSNEKIYFINTLDSNYSANTNKCRKYSLPGSSSATDNTTYPIGFVSGTITSGQVMVADGTTGAIKTSGYTIAKSVPSNAVFTDTNNKVTQSNTNTSNWRHIILGCNDWSDTEPSTDNVTDKVYRNNNIKISPYLGRISLYGSSPQAYLKSSVYDFTASDNGVSEESWAGYRILDKNERHSSYFISRIMKNGTIYSDIKACNYNTDGSTTYTASIQIGLNKSGDSWIDISSDTVLNMRGSRINRDGTTPSSRVYSPRFAIKDADNEALTYIRNYQESNGIIGTQFMAFNEKTDGTEIYNIFEIKVAKDGTQSYYVSNQAAFRTAIGAGTSDLTIGTTATTAMAGNKTFTTTIAKDSGTNQLTLAESTKYKLTAGGTSYIFTTPPNTKNTAGSTDTTSKIYLIGATEQSANPQTYSDDQVYVTNGSLYLTKETDAEGAKDNKPALLIGNPTGTHLELDTNEVMAKASATTTANLYLNNNGGTVYIGSGGLKLQGNLMFDTATQRLNSAKNLTGENVSTPEYVVGLTTDWASFGYTSITNLKTTLGLGSNAYTSTSYLPLAGGTMTGLTKHKSSTIDRDGSNPSQQQANEANIEFYDKNNEIIGCYRSLRNTDGSMQVTLGVFGEKTDNTQVANYFSIIAKRNGDQTYSVTSPANFRTAIGAGTGNGTVTSVKVGTTSYNPSSGVVSLPAYPGNNYVTQTVGWGGAASTAHRPVLFGYSQHTGSSFSTVTNSSFCVSSIYGDNNGTLTCKVLAQTSDRRNKKNIEVLDNRYLDLIKKIEPKRFKFKDDDNNKYHIGFITQEIEEELSKVNLTKDDFGGLIESGPEMYQTLVYTDFIPILLKYTKELEKRIEILEKREEQN